MKIADIVFVNTHPIQYFGPLYKQMTLDPTLNLKVFYLTGETIEGYYDKQFNKTIQWDIPLLEGYSYSFIKNNSWKPSLYKGFFGLINLGVWTEFKKIKPKAIIVIHGWSYFSLIWACFSAIFWGHILCLRGETPWNQVAIQPLWKRVMKIFVLRTFLFPIVDKFLYIGSQNRLFYRKFGVPDSKLIFTPYSVDNFRFRNDYALLKAKRKELRERMNLEMDSVVILFSGKYIPKKRPMDLLKAACLLSANFHVVMMGDGSLRGEMEDYIIKNKLSNRVTLTGFINQSKISNYYSIADIFVMCSGDGETWGLSVNEAMNFNLPLVVSDTTGCSDDLVEHGKNGFIFREADISGLAGALMQIIHLSKEDRAKMGHHSFEIVSNYSYQSLIENLKKSFAESGYFKTT